MWNRWIKQTLFLILFRTGFDFYEQLKFVSWHFSWFLRLLSRLKLILSEKSVNGVDNSRKIYPRIYLRKNYWFLIAKWILNEWPGIVFCKLSLFWIYKVKQKESDKYADDFLQENCRKKIDEFIWKKIQGHLPNRVRLLDLFLWIFFIFFLHRLRAQDLYWSHKAIEEKNNTSSSKVVSFISMVQFS